MRKVRPQNAGPDFFEEFTNFFTERVKNYKACKNLQIYLCFPDDA